MNDVPPCAAVGVQRNVLVVLSTVALVTRFRRDRGTRTVGGGRSFRVGDGKLDHKLGSDGGRRVVNRGQIRRRVDHHSPIFELFDVARTQPPREERRLVRRPFLRPKNPDFISAAPSRWATWVRIDRGTSTKKASFVLYTLKSVPQTVCQSTQTTIIQLSEFALPRDAETPRGILPSLRLCVSAVQSKLHQSICPGSHTTVTTNDSESANAGSPLSATRIRIVYSPGA